MQILKDEIKQAILGSATREFYQKGYGSASMRVIAKNADITVGNLYRYFKSKEEIFEAVVTPFYEELLSYLDHEEQSFSLEDTKLLLTIMEDELKPFLELVSNNREVMIILFRSSENTRFAHIKDEFTERFTEHIIEHLKVEGVSFPSPGYKHLPKCSAVSFIEGLLTLIEDEEDTKVLFENTSRFVALFILGFVELITHEREK